MMFLNTMKSFKSRDLFLVLMLSVLGMSVMSVTAVSIDAKDIIKANVQFRVKVTALTVATQYTLYVDDALKGNKSTTATGTTLTFKTTVGESLVGQFIDIEVRNITGTGVLATHTAEVVDIIPQSSIDMIGGLMPLIMVFSVVFVVVFRVPQKIGELVKKI